MATDPSRRAPPPGKRDSEAIRRKNTAETAGTLFVVATPIGNLGDFAPRAREVLGAADLILAEDTRHTAQLLHACAIDRPLSSLHEHNEAERVPELVERLRKGDRIALVSDAGTPLISDPGYRLVRAAVDAGIRVTPVPGACAAIAALSISGMPTDKFTFEGFLPAKSAARGAALQALACAQHSLVFYEAPHRLREVLGDMAATFGAQRKAVVARELTKTFETVYRGTLAELAARASTDPDMTRGETVILVEGAQVAQDVSSAELDRVLSVLLNQLPVRQAAELAVQLTNAPPNTAYRRALALGKPRG